jgi:superfamily I DNA/RNA helicase
VTFAAAVEERLSRLAPDQRSAATAPPGPVLCVAPAGSGKTTTLVGRICWLVASGVEPGSITAITFNRRAADELQHRVRDALSTLATPDEEPRIRTFHALGREVLRDAGVDVTRLVDRASVFAELFPGQPAWIHRGLDDAFSRLKLDLRPTGDELRQAALIDPPSGRRPGPRARGCAARPRGGSGRPVRSLDPRVARAYVEYTAALEAAAALDFDDLVVRALEVLGRDPALLEHWRQRCAELLVDEVQDVDRSQLDLALLLAGDRRHIFLVGDDDQTIYAWRLADVRRVIGLAARLPGLRRFDLTVNYRCPTSVVDRAVRLVSRNRERFAKEIRARQGAEGRLLLAALPTDDATRARRLLARWRGEGLAVEPGLAVDGGPPAPQGPAPPTTFAVLARTNAELAPFAAVALELGVPFSAEEHRLVLGDPRVDAVLDQAEAADGPNAPPLPALGHLGRDAETASVIGSLLEWAAAYPTLAALRDAIAEARERLGHLHREGAPLVLATVHGTKGLEFDHVAVVGLDEGRFPSRRSLEEAEDPARALEEERRLAYVAWTRARRTLTLVFDPGAPSLFLRDAFSAAELAAA